MGEVIQFPTTRMRQPKAITVLHGYLVRARLGERTVTLRYANVKQTQSVSVAIPSPFYWDLGGLVSHADAGRLMDLLARWAMSRGSSLDICWEYGT